MEEAEWPSQPIPKPVKKLVARFYRLADCRDLEAHQRLADEVFTEDGELVLNKRRMQGREQISKWHTHMGSDEIMSRKHKIDKVYVCNDQSNDLMMTGTLTMESDVGLIGEAPLCARCVVDDAASSTPRIKYWQGWLDISTFLELGIMRPPSQKMFASGILDTIGGR